MTILLDAIRSGDPAAVARVLDAHPDLKARLNDPLDGYGFGQTALLAAVNRGNRETIDVLLVLLDAGATDRAAGHGTP